MGKILTELGVNTKIFTSHGKTDNSLFNNFTSDENYDKEKTVVIYCEGIQGNPLNAKYIVRWMLSKLGQNVPVDFADTWDNNELVYFFNSEMDIIDNSYDAKYLSLFYINPIFKNNNIERSGVCFTVRKRVHNYFTIHKENSFEITRQHTHNDYLDIFNKQGDVFRRITLNNCFLIQPITTMALDYDSGDALYTITTSWKSDYWQDQFL
jgi:hypothetical protein